MEAKLISAIDLASEMGRHKQTIIKIINRLQMETQKISTLDSRGQLVLHITEQDADRIRELLNAVLNDDGEDTIDDHTQYQDGVFYLIQLEPALDPGRFKVGFTTDLDYRLRQLRCSAPYANVLRSWACRPLWERTAIQSVTSECELIRSEVFRAASIEEVIARCERFFELMPR